MYQVGSACYPTQLQAAQASASAQVGAVVQQGGSAHVVELRAISGSSITYGLRPAAGGASIEVVSAYEAQPCNLLGLGDGLTMGWMVGGAWLAVFGLMFIARTVFHVGGSTDDGNS